MSRVGHRDCSLHTFVQEDLPPPGKQTGRSLIPSPLYCRCHCHHHSHWEEHTTLTPCVLRGRIGASGAIKLAIYTQHSREKATPSTHHVQAQWELGSAQGGPWAMGRCMHMRTCRGRALEVAETLLGLPTGRRGWAADLCVLPDYSALGVSPR